MQFELIEFGMEILGMIPIILLVLLMLWGFVRGSGRTRTLSLLAFLGYLFVAIEYLTGPIMLIFVSSIIGSLAKGIWLFLLAVYCFIWALPDLINERKWLVIVLLVMPIAYETLTLLLFYGAGVWYYSAEYFTIVYALFAIAAVFVIYYMALIPLYCTIRYVSQDRIKGTTRVIWIWLTLIGVLIWFLGEFLPFAGTLLSLSSSTYSIGIFGLRTVGWWTILLGNFLQRWAIQAG